MGLALLGPVSCGGGSGGDDHNVNSNDNGNNQSSSICGNGVREGAEACDDGAANSDASPDACRTDCTEAGCGDGVIDSGEACDDGAANSDQVPDACRSGCEAPACGDGVVDVQSGETCDDGNTTSGDGCSESCRVEMCGNGSVDPGEECDDGNVAAGDGCGPTCLTEGCGNGFIDPGEECDDGNTVADAACGPTCLAPRCGNGVLDPGEECDEGDLTAGDGCGPTCLTEGCGNGFVDPGEECDDGNTVADAACGPTCLTPRCGNGVVDVGEECDDGNTLADAACGSTCLTPACGNGVVDFGEECDDGNTVADAACGPTCLMPRCGNGVQDVGEECDDGNALPDAMCGPTCLTPACGNGVLDFGEECDDGNHVSHDRCSSGCTAEAVTWAQASTVAREPRTGASLVYIGGGQSLLVGGMTQLGYAAGTWIYDGTAWRRAGTTTEPSARTEAVAAYDAHRGKVVLFGGQDGSGFLDDTWEFDVSQESWQEVTGLGTKPSARSRASMAYDAGRQEVVLFGGATGNARAIKETWTYNGAWTRKDTSLGRAGAAMAYDPQNQRVVFFGGFDESGGSGCSSWNPCTHTYAWDGSTWSLVSSTGPEPARFAGLAYSSTSGKLLLFGGQAAVGGWHFINDLWELDGATWTQRTPPAPLPPARYYVEMVYDDAAARLLVLEGSGDEGRLDDLWAYDDSGTPGSWTQRYTNMPPTGSPGSHIAGSETEARAVYDSHRGVVVLYLPALGDTHYRTWEFDGASWRTIATTHVPTTRHRCGMTFDEDRGVVVIWGGGAAYNSSLMNDTWEYDGTDWTQRFPTGNPPGRWSPAVAYDPVHHEVVRFGGGVNTMYYAETWVYDGAAWTNRSPSPTPDGRIGAALAFDHNLGKVVLFGGYARTSSGIRYMAGDTWTWDGAAWQEITPAISPGPGSDVVLVWHGERQRLVQMGGGETWELDGSATPPTWFHTQSTTDWFSAAAAAYFPALRAILSHREKEFFYWNDSTWPQEQCRSSLDEDLDGLAQCADPDCDALPCDDAGHFCSAGTCQ